MIAVRKAGSGFHIDVLFAGAYGVQPDVGVTGSKVSQAGAQHNMLRHADALVVMADAAKFGRQGSTVLAGIDQVHTFVTDEDVPAADLAALRDRGANVTVC